MTTVTASTAVPLATRVPRVGLRGVAVHALVLAWRNLAQIPRNPQLLVFIAIQPVMFTLLFAYVFGGAISTPGVDYIDFLVPGILVQTVAFGTTATAVGLSEDLHKGLVDRFRAMPIARSAVLAGRVLSDAVRLLVTVAIIVGVGALIGFDFQAGVGRAVAFVAVAVAFGVALSWVAALIGLAVSNPEVAQSAGFIWLFPLTFASSAFVPTGSMPGWLQAFADVNPITLTVDGLRALALGGDLDPVWWSLLWVAGITAVAAPAAVARYRRIR
jgi:ABC-2 type transport system permease protein/oleandomycin transport system permease protein